MKPKIMGRFLVAAALLAGAGVAGAADRKAAGPETDASVAESVRHEIVMYSNYTLWDDVNIQVNSGNVALTGAVNQPFKKLDIDRIVRRLPGVTHVQNDLRVLPASFDDDRLRLRVARAVYGDPALFRYAVQPLKPIHILVENGHVTLAGLVSTQFDKQIAGMRASGAGLSFGPVINNLQVENPPAKKT